MALALQAAPSGKSVTVSSEIDHTAYDALLKKHVDAKGLVDYEAWKKSAADMKALRDYLATYEPKPEKTASGNVLNAALANLYNASTISFILSQYPTDSIKSQDDPFTEERYLVGGDKISADDIEHGTLRPLIGYKAHAILVCAARSCPPLQQEAYEAKTFDSQVETAFKVWLSRPDLNQFDPKKNSDGVFGFFSDEIQVSKIFDWYRKDFKKAGGLRGILAKYAPATHQKTIKDTSNDIGFLDYNWDLNAQH